MFSSSSTINYLTSTVPNNNNSINNQGYIPFSGTPRTIGGPGPGLSTSDTYITPYRYANLRQAESAINPEVVNETPARIIDLTQNVNNLTQSINQHHSDSIQQNHLNSVRQSLEDLIPTTTRTNAEVAQNIISSQNIFLREGTIDSEVANLEPEISQIRQRIIDETLSVLSHPTIGTNFINRINNIFSSNYIPEPFSDLTLIELFEGFSLDSLNYFLQLLNGHNSFRVLFFSLFLLRAFYWLIYRKAQFVKLTIWQVYALINNSIISALNRSNRTRERLRRENLLITSRNNFVALERPLGRIVLGATQTGWIRYIFSGLRQIGNGLGQVLSVTSLGTIFALAVRNMDTLLPLVERYFFRISRQRETIQNSNSVEMSASSNFRRLLNELWVDVLKFINRELDRAKNKK